MKNVNANIIGRRTGFGILETRLSNIAIGNITLEADNIYGYTPQKYVGGDLTIDLTGADPTKKAVVYFDDVVKPVVTIIGGSADIIENGDFVEGSLCIMVFMYNGVDVIQSFNHQL